MAGKRKRESEGCFQIDKWTEKNAQDYSATISFLFFNVRFLFLSLLAWSATINVFIVRHSWRKEMQSSLTF